MDETYAGVTERGVIGRQTKTKAAVMIAPEAAGAEIGRIRMSPVSDVSAHSLERCVQKSISVGSVVYTEGWRGYSGLKRHGYQHRSKEYRSQRGSSPRGLASRLSGLLSPETLMIGETVGGLSHVRLAYHFNEFMSRFNRRLSRAQGMLFYRLLQHALPTELVPYKKLVGGRHLHVNNR
jgi:transposase-like protein